MILHKLPSANNPNRLQPNDLQILEESNLQIGVCSWIARTCTCPAKGYGINLALYGITGDVNSKYLLLLSIQFKRRGKHEENRYK